MSEVLKVPSAGELRERLQELVMQDLLGPAGGPDEEVTDRTVRERYLVGMLAPSGQSLEPEEFDDLGVEGGRPTEDGQADLPAIQTSTMSPSSFGLSFQVDGTCDRLRLEVAWGHYERTDSETVTNAGGRTPPDLAAHPQRWAAGRATGTGAAKAVETRTERAAAGVRRWPRAAGRRAGRRLDDYPLFD